MFPYFLVEVEDVFKLGSMKPGAMLHDASREYEVDIITFVTSLYSVDSL